MTESKRSDEGDSPSGPDGEIRAEYDWSTVAPSLAVIETIAIALDREPTTIEPLFESVDPDALDRLVHSDGFSSADGGPYVRFTHVGHDVTVHAGGTVVTRPTDSR